MPRLARAVFAGVPHHITQRGNQERSWKGHLWQGRFFSSPLDETYLWAAMRYVERNLVRAKIASKAEQYA